MKKLFVVLFSAALLAGADLAAQAKPRPNLIIVTAKYYSRVDVHAEAGRAIPADVTKASADELRAVWGPFVAEAGMYEVTDGNVITMRPIARPVTLKAVCVE